MTQKETKTKRRKFLKTSAVTASAVALDLHAFGAPAAAQPVSGANDKIRMGFIGVGNRGWKLLRSFMSRDMGTEPELLVP